LIVIQQDINVPALYCIESEFTCYFYL